jgi:hypothetical protein
MHSLDFQCVTAKRVFCTDKLRLIGLFIWGVVRGEKFGDRWHRGIRVTYSRWSLTIDEPTIRVLKSVLTRGQGLHNMRVRAWKVLH